MNENFNKMENIMKDSSLSDMNRNIEFIKDIVSFFYGESKIVYELKTRKSKILKIKHIAIYICAKNLKLTLVQLGEKFNYDHSMIVHIKKKYEGYLEFDNELKKELADIQNILNFRLAGELNLEKEHYYIPLNDFISIKNNNGKAIILKGFTDEEIKRIRITDSETNKSIFEPTEAKQHTNQKFYILEKKENEKNNNFS